jgi:hypothetical protein
LIGGVSISNDDDIATPCLEEVTVGHRDGEVDGIPVAIATEATGQVRGWIDRGFRLSADGTDESQLSSNTLMWPAELSKQPWERDFVAKPIQVCTGDKDFGHGQLL